MWDRFVRVVEGGAAAHGHVNAVLGPERPSYRRVGTGAETNPGTAAHKVGNDLARVDARPQ